MKHWTESVELAIIDAGLCPHGRGNVKPWACNMCAETCVKREIENQDSMDRIYAAITDHLIDGKLLPWSDPNHDVAGDLRRWARPGRNQTHLLDLTARPN